MRVLGIDPGVIVTGYGVIEAKRDVCRVLEAGVVRTNIKASMALRLRELAHEVEAIIKQFEPEVLAVEELYSHYGHPKTAIIMGHARGIVFLKAA